MSTDKNAVLSALQQTAEESAEAKRMADQKLRAAVVSAVKAGITRADVFEATGIARTTINRWLAEAESK
ncbi:helix-turn-helix DNA binding domain protein [Gordonia phage Octobien14]|uniref:Helix-turn-helix DNA binding domain protein n=1 Tax=Gordonia phage Octobien14 TaxID=2483673 RepID=A0A3G3MA22_9CAUD|nr:helix-turn-helix DNA binding domain protein [Gordonia phage Octobien14]AYR03265.1 helix-turn-helix DNA binding domain protein [Gordonia phage Octobien14]